MARAARKTEWGSMCCQTERDKIACASWFRPLVPESWGLPLAAQVLIEIETDKEKAIRAAFMTERGLRVATRHINKGGWRLTFDLPTDDVLRAMHLTRGGVSQFQGAGQ